MGVCDSVVNKGKTSLKDILNNESQYNQYSDTAFDKVDTNKNGYIEKNELGALVQELITQFKKDNTEKKFKNVVIIPIYSFYDFLLYIEPKDKEEFMEKNILAHFSNLNIDEQPFILFIDYSEEDFLKEVYAVEKEFVFKRFYNCKRLDIDFDIHLQINIKTEDKDKIEILKKLFLTKKNNGDNFEISINDKYFYQNFHGDENRNLDSFYEAFEDRDIKVFKISILLINQSMDFLEELGEYEKLEREIISVEFIQYTLKKDKLSSILSIYNKLDERNVSVKRSKKTQRYQLFKYVSFYNNLEDILYCEQKAYYPFKLNIGIGGFSRSGRSSFINTILREKRCSEKEDNNKQYVFS